MLIRFLVGNFFSFDEITEFNTLPGAGKRFREHKIRVGQVKVLKLQALYGANGAGKSNLVRAIGLLQQWVSSGKIPPMLYTQSFRLKQQSSELPIYLGIEFFHKGHIFYYGIKSLQGIVLEEELYQRDSAQNNDTLLFRRTDDPGEKKLQVQFSSKVMEDKNAIMFRQFLQDELLDRQTLVLHFMKNRNSSIFEPYYNAYEWLVMFLEVIMPESRPTMLALQMERIKPLYEFSKRILKVFGTGITDMQLESIPIEDFFGEDQREVREKIWADLRANPSEPQWYLGSKDEVLFVLQGDGAFAKLLRFYHDARIENAQFSLSEESDGTRRLVEYLPALYDLVHLPKTYIIDEIERSIHPLLVRQLIRKFSNDPKTQGQLIFTTHESNLLNQDIFRTDEIWFAEKSGYGATELYSLYEFKEHHTIDIRKGYLQGRYGAIPFLGNLKDLNWE